MHKSLHRLLLLVVALATGAISLIAVAPSAHAATYASKTLISSTKTVVLHGTSVKIKGCVTVPDYKPGCAPSGAVRLERRIVGKSAWTTVNTKSLATTGGLPEWIIKPSYSAYYRLVFGGTDFEGHTFQRSTSAAKLIRVARNLHDKWVRSSFTYGGLVTPTYAGKYVYIQRTTCSNPQASTCKWSHYKALKTTSSSRWKIKLPAYRQTNYFRAYIKPSSGYAPSYSNYYIETKRYRPGTARVVR